MFDNKYNSDNGMQGNFKILGSQIQQPLLFFGTRFISTVVIEFVESKTGHVVICKASFERIYNSQMKIWSTITEEKTYVLRDVNHRDHGVCMCVSI